MFSVLTKAYLIYSIDILGQTQTSDKMLSAADRGRKTMACKDLSASFTGSHSPAPHISENLSSDLGVLGPQENAQGSTELHNSGKK